MPTSMQEPVFKGYCELWCVCVCRYRYDIDLKHNEAERFTSCKITPHLNYLIQLMACFLYPTGVYWLSALSSELFNLDFSCQTNSPSNCASNKATQNNTHSPIIICAYTLYIWVGESFACVVCECHKSEFSLKRNDWKVNIRENISVHWTKG